MKPLVIFHLFSFIDNKVFSSHLSTSTRKPDRNTHDEMSKVALMIYVDSIVRLGKMIFYEIYINSPVILSYLKYNSLKSVQWSRRLQMTHRHSNVHSCFIAKFPHIIEYTRYSSENDYSQVFIQEDRQLEEVLFFKKKHKLAVHLRLYCSLNILL